MQEKVLEAKKIRVEVKNREVLFEDDDEYVLHEQSAKLELKMASDVLRSGFFGAAKRSKKRRAHYENTYCGEVFKPLAVLQSKSSLRQIEGFHNFLSRSAETCLNVEVTETF